MDDILFRLFLSLFALALARPLVAYVGRRRAAGRV